MPAGAALGRLHTIPPILRWEHGDALQEQESTDSSRTTANFRLRELFFFLVSFGDGVGDKPTLSEKRPRSRSAAGTAVPGPRGLPFPHPHGRALPGPAHRDSSRRPQAAPGTGGGRRRNEGGGGAGGREPPPAPQLPPRRLQRNPAHNPEAAGEDGKWILCPVSFPGVCVRDAAAARECSPDPGRGARELPGARGAPAWSTARSSWSRSAAEHIEILMEKGSPIT